MSNSSSSKNEEELIRSAVPLVRSLASKMANKYHHLGLVFEDALADGLYGAFLAARAFDPDRGVLFTTYAYPNILQYMKLGARFGAGETTRGTGGTTSLQPLLDEGYDVPALLAEPEAGVVHEEVRGAVGALGLRERKVVALTYWGGEGPTAVGREVGLSKSGARVVLARAHEELRQKLAHLEGIA